MKKVGLTHPALGISDPPQHQTSVGRTETSQVVSVGTGKVDLGGSPTPRHDGQQPQAHPGHQALGDL